MKAFKWRSLLQSSCFRWCTGSRPNIRFLVINSLQAIKAFSLCVIAIFLSACDQSSAKLFVANGLAQLSDYRLQSNIAYGELSQQQLDIYQPVLGVDNKQATVVFFYGGCWGHCTEFTKADYRFVAEALVAEGYTVVVPDYRLFPAVKFAEIIDDARLAVEWTRDKATASNQRLFLMGHSAGGHLAAMLTVDERYLSQASRDQLAGFIGLAGPYDFLPFTKPYQQVLFAPESFYPDSQPVNFIEGTEPPMLLLYGLDDSTVKPRNHQQLAARVTALNGRVVVREYQGLDHSGLVGALSKPMRKNLTVHTDILKFLNANR